MKQLKPILNKVSYHKEIEKQIKMFFDELLYNKIFELVNEIIGHYYNSSSILKEAILKGQIQYNDGKFYGKFNAQITKELKSLGATWSKDHFILKTLPDDLMELVVQAQDLFKTLHYAILDVISKTDVDDLLKTFNFDTSYIKTLTNLDEQTYKTLKDDVSIIPEFTEQMKKDFAENYTENLKLYIKNFTDEETLKLRQLVQDNVLNNGARAESLVKILQDRYGVSKNKATFWAKQETSLLVSEYRVERYKQIGITTWKWSSSHDSRVRPLHKELDGKIFDINEPPIIDEKGNRGYGGQAFGCRCIMIGMI